MVYLSFNAHFRGCNWSHLHLSFTFGNGGRRNWGSLCLGCHLLIQSQCNGWCALFGGRSGATSYSSLKSMSSGIDSSPEDTCESSAETLLPFVGQGMFAHPVGFLVLGSVWELSMVPRCPHLHLCPSHPCCLCQLSHTWEGWVDSLLVQLQFPFLSWLGLPSW